MLKHLFDRNRAWMLMCVALLMAVVISQVQGCAALGVPTADTVNKKAAEGYIAITAAANTVVTLRAAGKMNEAERDKAVGVLQSSKIALDAVVKSAPTEPGAADERLRQILLVVSALSAGLAAQQAGGK